MHKALSVLAVLGLAAAAQAQVTNGDFETGDLTGWTQGGNGGFTGVTTTLPHSGTFGFQMGPVGSTGFIEQIIPCTAGDRAILEFWVACDGGAPSFFSATLDGQNVLTLVDSVAFGYTQYSFAVPVTNTNPVLRFEYQNNPTYYYLDDVSVTCVPAPAAAALLLGAPLAGLRRRRR